MKRAAGDMVGVALWMALVANCYSQETTNTQEIVRIQYIGTSEDIYFIGPEAWRSPTCPGATYAWVKGSLQGRKEILSIGLAAHMSGRRVRFWGACDVNTNYFNAFYVVIE